MIPFALLKGKGLLVGAIALALILAWGGFGWWGKARIERNFEAYRGQQARLVARQQETIIQEQQRAAEKAQEVSSAYQKGARDIRARWDAERVRNQARTNSGPMPTPADTALGPDAASCEDRLLAGLRETQELRAALGEAIDAFRDAELISGQLERLQQFNER